MDRRKFIRNSIGAGVAGSAMVNGLYIPGAFGSSPYDLPDIGIPSPHLQKLKVKPLMTNMYHTAEWQGPCRFNVVPMEQEKQRALSAFEEFKGQAKAGVSGLDPENCRVMDPDLVLFVEDFEIPGDQYAKIDRDAREADVLFMAPSGSSIATYEIAKKYRKPVVISWGLNCRTVDIAAYCNSNGLEVYVPHTGQETADLMAVLRARKVFGQTRILYPTDRGWPSVASVAGINEPRKLKDMYGIELVTISYAELSEEMDKTRASKEEKERAGKMAAVMAAEADKLYLDEEYVARSMEFYNTVIRLMKKHDCNSFTIECFEFCVSRLPQKWQITPCLIHTMFKDLGIPSACEGDLGGLLSMHVLMSLSKKSSHLGNMFFRDGGRLEINHSVPGIKMNGWKEPALPYRLGNFVEEGWGTKAVVDFMNNDEKRVTVARMNPEGTGILILKGKLVDSNGYDEDLLGCSVSAFIVGSESGTAEEFMRREVKYGNHLSWVYGDYAPQIVKMGELTGFDVEVVS